LGEAIRFGQLALDITPQNHADYAQRHNNVGTYFRERFSRAGDIKDLEEAIRLAQLALGVTPIDHPNHAHYLNNLGVYLRIQYLRTGETGPLEEAIPLGQLALDNTPENHPNRAERLNNMGAHFQQRFLRRGEMKDLEKAIELGQLALGVTQEDHPNRAQRLDALSTRFRDRFSRVGDMKDLEESIRLGQLALDATLEDHPDYAERLNNVGGYFQMRFLRNWELGDLKEAIRLAQLALDTIPDGHADRGHYLNKLGSLLGDRFSRFGDLNDLEDSIRLRQLALEITPKDHPDYTKLLNNLGTCFRDRFQRRSELTDLEEAIRFGQLALGSVPEDLPDRGYYLNHLGIRFGERFSRKRERKDLDESTRLFRQSLHYPGGTPFARVTAGIYAAKNLVTFSHWRESAVSFEEALNLLPKVTPRTSSRQDLQHTLQQLSNSASLAASVFLKAGRSPLEALQILEQGRGVIAGLVVDSRSDVSSLRELHPDLYMDYTRLREIVATPLLPELSLEDTSSQAIPLRESYALRSSQRYKSAEDLDKVLEQIRQQPGFNRFQLPPTEAEIINLAAFGPLISFNISKISAEAFIITTSGVQALQLPNLKEMDLKSALLFLSKKGNSNRRDAKIVSETSESGISENEGKNSLQSVSSQMLSL
jgi:tetratricopeptide (TPR) repeat protein